MVGLILGDVHTGLLVGAQIEMMSLGMMAVGATRVDMNMGAIVGCAMVISTGATVETALAIAVPVTVLDNILLQVNSIFRLQFTHMIDHYVEKSQYNKAKFVHRVCGPLLYATFWFVPVFIAVYFGNDVINAAINAVPQFILDGITLGSRMITFYGFAMLLSNMVNKKNVIFFFAGFVVAAVSGLSLTVLALIAIIVAVILYQVRYQDTENQTMETVDDLESLD